MTAQPILWCTVVALVAVTSHAHSNTIQWENIAKKLRDLSDPDFFGMHFVLNITGERCIPQWHFPKPPCWGHGWPWPWPQPSKTSTTRPTTTTKRTSPAGTTRPGATTKPTVAGTTKLTTVAGTTRPTTPGATTRPTTQGGTTRPTTQGGTTRPTQAASTNIPGATSTAATSTTTAIATTPTTPSGPETTTCAYNVDLADQTYCREIKYASDPNNATGSLKDCAKYFDYDTVISYYNDCVQFNCKYQREYRCYGMLPFINNCTQHLTGEETVYGWRANNGCEQNSTPYPAITFTDLPTSSPTSAPAVVKRSVRDDSDESDSDEDETNATSAGTKSVAKGIKFNWCVPKIFSWWHKTGGKQPSKPVKGWKKGNNKGRKNKKNHNNNRS